MLFEAPYTSGKRDSEAFVNPNITSCDIMINGLPSKRYGKGMLNTDFWNSVTGRYGLNDYIRNYDFYKDKFALWIDLRTHPDDTIHGSGLGLSSSMDGIKLCINRTADTTAVSTTCYMYVVSDALIELEDSALKSIIY